MKQKQLVMTALGLDRPETLNDLMKLTAQAGCNILDCRARVLGLELCLHMLVIGSWSAIAKLETSLASYEKKHDLRILSKHTESPAQKSDVIPYLVYVTALDTPGMIYKITDFFDVEKINVSALHTENFSSPRTAAPMVTITLAIDIPADMLVADLRERLTLFCDEQNLDAIMEPEKR
jgi:glycine cleavage system transcriptional repressor